MTQPDEEPLKFARDGESLLETLAMNRDFPLVRILPGVFGTPNISGYGSRLGQYWAEPEDDEDTDNPYPEPGE
jgi:hypothetical protein